MRILTFSYYRCSINCKTWIDDSTKEVKDITSSIKNIKEELISLDPDFSHDYLQLIEQFSSCKIDVSGLTDEELNIYNMQKDIIAREYNDTLLSIFKEASEKGELDEELQLAYDIEKRECVIAIYDIEG